MFKIILVSVILGLAAAASVNSGTGGDYLAETRSYVNNPADADGNFAYSFDTSNGITAQESGNIAGVTGASQYISPEGIAIQVTYTADQDGYHPVGDHLPTPPPVPEPILRAIAYIAAHPPQQERIGNAVVQVQQPYRTSAPFYQPQQAKRIPTVPSFRKPQFSG